MRTATTCELRRDGRLVARGLAEIRTYPTSWDVSVFATAGYDVHRLTTGDYELCIADDRRHPVQLVEVTRSSGEIRLLGLGPPPGLIGSRRLDDFGLGRAQRRRTADERDPSTGR